MKSTRRSDTQSHSGRRRRRIHLNLMHFWNNILQTAGMGGAFPWMIIGTLGAAAALHFLRPRERARVSGAAILFALSLIGTLAGSAVLYFAEPAHPAFVTIRGIAQFMQAVAIINLTAVFIFAVALSAMRLETPRIVQDLLIGIAYVITALVVLSGSGIETRRSISTALPMASRRDKPWCSAIASLI